MGQAIPHMSIHTHIHKLSPLSRHHPDSLPAFSFSIQSSLFWLGIFSCQSKQPHDDNWCSGLRLKWQRGLKTSAQISPSLTTDSRPSWEIPRHSQTKSKTSGSPIYWDVPLVETDQRVSQWAGQTIQIGSLSILRSSGPTSRLFQDRRAPPPITERKPRQFPCRESPFLFPYFFQS